MNKITIYKYKCNYTDNYFYRVMLYLENQNITRKIAIINKNVAIKDDKI